MSDRPLGPEQILQRLEGLRRLAEHVTGESSRLRDEQRLREEQSRLRSGAMERNLTGWLESELARLDNLRATTLEAAEGRARHRALRIREAQRNARRAAMERLDAEEGRRKFELQREMLRSTREHDAGIAAADAAHAAFGTELDARQAELLVLEAEARSLLGVYGRRLARRLAAAHEGVAADLSRPEDPLLAELTRSLTITRAELTSFRRQPLPWFSRAWPLWLVVVLSPIIAIPALPYFGLTTPTPRTLLAAAGGFAVFAGLLHLLGRQLAAAAIRRMLGQIGLDRVLLHGAREQSAATRQREHARLRAAHEETTHRCNEGWNRTLAWLEETRATRLADVDARTTRALARSETLRLRHREQAGHRHTLAVEQARTEAARRRDEHSREAGGRQTTIAGDLDSARRTLLDRWNAEAAPLLDELDRFAREMAAPHRSSDCLPPASWTPPKQTTPGTRFGQIDIRLDQVLAGLPSEFVTGSVRDRELSLPLLLRPPDQGSLLVEAGPGQRSGALGTINHLLCRLLAAAPPGRVAFTLFDPVGLGQSFAGLSHLADEAEHLICGRIWTQSAQLEERLAELTEHLEKVIQMYLRNEYETIEEYNDQAGSIAEKHRYLVVADFPAGFTDVALRRLLNLAASGARCGVHLLIHRDLRQSLPTDFPIAALRQAGLTLELDGPTPRLNGRAIPGTGLRLDLAPETAALTSFLQRVARANLDSNRVEVPFDHVIPAESELWTADTAAEIRVPIGRTGATKLQYLGIGRGTRQHALVAGKTGSGKSTLFHVLVTNLALWCRPDQIEFYLVDFKKGVEFKCYATHRLPHARVVAIESDREFGLSVLQRLDDELRRRGELFRAARVQDLPAYRRTPDAVPMPRVLLLVDEFQEFFVEEDRIAQNASALLDRIVRQGRAFGLHVILGSQTLGGAYTVARSTLGQMVVRIALQCNEADALLIMDEDNPAPRLLSRPGEGIYNDEAGARAGNSPFQVVWLPDDVRDIQLKRIRERADSHSPALRNTGPLVFEGDAPAEISGNPELRRRLEAPAVVATSAPRCWLGAPNSIKGPTEVTFARRSGDHLLVIGQRDDALLALIGLSLIALAAQQPRGGAEFVLLDATPPDSPDRAWLEAVVRAIPHPVTVARGSEVGAVVSRLGEELQSRTAAPAAGDLPARFLIVHGLQNHRALRPEDEFAGFGGGEAAPSPAARFKDLVHEGPPHGFHVIATCDTWNNVTRWLGRKTLSEFGLRVLFQMSANDSASLIDNPAACRLGFHRALLYQDREGSLEVFRPYALPDTAWVAEAGRELARLLPAGTGEPATVTPAG